MYEAVAHLAVIPGADAKVKVFVRRDSDSYAKGMKELVAEINAAGVDAVVELHLDVRNVESKRRHGSMGLHWPTSSKGEALAEKAARACAATLGLPYVGTVAQARSWSKVTMGTNGDVVPGGPPLYILRDTIAPAAILEAANMLDRDDTRAVRRAVDSGAFARMLVHLAETL